MTDRMWQQKRQNLSGRNAFSYFHNIPFWILILIILKNVIDNRRMDDIMNI